MRFLVFTFLFIFVSCGQSTSSKKSGDDSENAEFVTNVREVDLLDVAMDIPVEIVDGKIIFKETFTDSANGIRSTCSVGVTSGESYSFKLSSNSLIIQTPAGQKMSYTRVSGAGDSIVGSWTGKFREGEQLVMRRMTFVSQDRLVMRTHCES